MFREIERAGTVNGDKINGFAGQYVGYTPNRAAVL
jgi:hypothetical protein